MRIVAKRTLRHFWERHSRAEAGLRAWFAIVSKADWTSPHDVRNDFGSVDFVADSRVIFDVGGNKYRIVARVSYEYKMVLIKFVGTHSEYDRINPGTVQ